MPHPLLPHFRNAAKMPKMPKIAKALPERSSPRLRPMPASVVPIRPRSALVAAFAVIWLALASIAVAQQPVIIRQAALSQPPFGQQPAGQPPERIPPPAAPGQPLALQPPGQPQTLTTPLGLPAVQEPPPGAEVLTLDDLEQVALVNNPSLARAQALVAAAQGNWVQVGLPPNVSWGYLGQQLGSGNRASQHALLLDGELVTAGKLRLNRAIAEQEIIRAQQILFAQQQRVLTDVRVAFYEALLAQRNLDLARQLLQIARDAEATASKLHFAGETSEVDLRQAEIEVFNAENNLNDAGARHFAAWQMLRAVIGVPQMPPLVLRGDIESVPDNLNWDETLARLLAISPEIAAAIANRDRAWAALIRARREPIPNVRFQTGVMQDQGINGKTDGIVQMLLPLPIINHNQGAIRQAQAELTAADRAVQQVELDLQNRLAPVYERYASAAYRVRRYREKILPAAQRSLELVRKGYAAGEFPVLNLLFAQTKYSQTNQQYLQSLLDLRSSAAQIEGLLLSNSLGTAPIPQ
jgi:outer membrane protein, heavy metal efflux system